MGSLRRDSSVWQRLFQARKTHPERRTKFAEKISFYRPGIEHLEDRTLLSASPGRLEAIFGPETSGLAVVSPGNAEPSYSTNPWLGAAPASGAALDAPVQVS